MRRVFRWGAIALGFVAVFCAGFIVGVLSHVGDPVVDIEVSNSTHKSIKMVRVTHEHGTAIASDIEPGAAKRVKFFAPGETSYRTTVEFADGEHVEGREQYAEVVADDGISERFHSY